VRAREDVSLEVAEIN